MSPELSSRPCQQLSRSLAPGLAEQDRRMRMNRATAPVSLTTNIMNRPSSSTRPLAFLVACLLSGALWAQTQKPTGDQGNPPSAAARPNPDEPGDGPPSGPGGFGNGGPGRG